MPEANKNESSTTVGMPVILIVEDEMLVRLVAEMTLQAEGYETLSAGDIDEAMALLRHGHGYEILENDTRVLEIKNGPYPGAERDRVRF